MVTVATVPSRSRDQVDRAEDLVRLGEPRQEVLEVAALDRRGELADQGRLGRPRRPVQEQVLARDDRQGDQVDDLVAADEPPLEHVDDLAAEPADRLLHHHPVPSVPGAATPPAARLLETSLDELPAGPDGLPGRPRPPRRSVRHRAASAPGARQVRRRQPALRPGPRARPRAAIAAGPPPSSADERVGRVDRPGAAVDLGQIAEAAGRPTDGRRPLDGGRRIVSRGARSSTRSPRLTSAQHACRTSSPASHATAASNGIAGPATSADSPHTPSRAGRSPRPTRLAPVRASGER